MKIKYSIINENDSKRNECIIIDFKTIDLFAIQAKNATCKTILYNSLMEIVNTDNNVNEISLDNNLLSIALENNDLDKKDITFYSYLEELKKSDYENGISLMSLLQDTGVAKYLLFDEFEKLKNSNLLSKFKLNFNNIFNFDLEKLTNITINFLGEKSNLEIFIEYSNKMFEYFSEPNNIELIDYLLNNNFFNFLQVNNNDWNDFRIVYHKLVKLYFEKKIIHDKDYTNAKEDIKKYQNSKSEGNYSNTTRVNALNFINNYHDELFSVFINLFDNSNLNGSYTKSFVQNILTYFKNVFFDFNINSSSQLMFISDFVLFLTLIKEIYNYNNHEIILFFSKIKWQKNKLLTTTINSIISKNMKIYRDSKINKIVKDFNVFFSDNFNIKRKKVLDYIFHDHDFCPLVFEFKGKEIYNSKLLSDGEINIILILSFYIKFLFTKKNVFVVDDSTVSLDKENQILLIHFIMHLIEKMNVKILILSHDSFFISTLQNICNWKKKSNTEFKKIEKINNNFLVYDFSLPHAKTILKSKITENNFVYKLAIYREISTILEKNNAIHLDEKNINYIFEPDNYLCKCEDEYFKTIYTKMNFLNLSDNITLLDYLIKKYIKNYEINYNVLYETKDDLFFHKFNLILIIRLISKKINLLNTLGNYLSIMFLHNSYLEVPFFLDFDFLNIEKHLKDVLIKFNENSRNNHE